MSCPANVGNDEDLCRAAIEKDRKASVHVRQGISIGKDLDPIGVERRVGPGQGQEARGLAAKVVLIEIAKLNCKHVGHGRPASICPWGCEEGVDDLGKACIFRPNLPRQERGVFDDVLPPSKGGSGQEKNCHRHEPRSRSRYSHGHSPMFSL